MVMDYPQLWARLEHAWLLKAEGLPLCEIANRLGVNDRSAQNMIKDFGRRVQRATSRVHWPRYLAACRSPLLTTSAHERELSYARAYALARREHAWLLRAEGLMFRQIGARLDVGPARARQLVFEFSRSFCRSLSNTRVRLDIERLTVAWAGLSDKAGSVR